MEDQIINIEKDKLRDLQSNMDILINLLKNNQISKEVLADLIFLNESINNLSIQIQDIHVKILDKKDDLSESNKIKLKNHNDNNKIIEKYLPYMLIESMNLA